MTKYLSIFIAILFACILPLAERINAQGLEWSKHSIILEYDGCHIDSLITVYLHNRGDNPIQLDTLIFYDSVYAWKISKGTQWLRQMIRAHDSVEFQFKSQANLEYRGWAPARVVVGAGSSYDTLWLRSREKFPLVKLQSTYLDFGLVEAPYVSQSVLITNIGDAPLLWVKGALASGDNQGLKFSLPNGPISPGETDTLLITPTQPEFTGYYHIEGTCSKPDYLKIESKSHLHRIQWSRASYPQVLSSCFDQPVFNLELLNSGDLPYKIDSVAFSDHASVSLELLDDLAGAQMLPGDSLKLRVRYSTMSNAYFDFSKTVMVYTSDGKVDAAPIDVFQDFADPVFKFGNDTTIIELKANEATNHTMDIENLAKGRYRFQAISLDPNDGWKVAKFDTTRDIGYHQRMDFSIGFLGSPVIGDHPVTYHLRGQPCDKLLTRTVIARVLEAKGLTHSEEPVSFKVYPSPAYGEVNVQCEPNSWILLSDVLGRQLSRTFTQVDRTLLKLVNVPPGSYIISVEKNGRRSSKRILIDR
jgi:hypothetical protein